MTPTLTLDQLRLRVRRHLQEMGQAAYPDDLVRDELNRSQRTLALEYELLQAFDTRTVTTNRFTPPADFAGFAGPVMLNGFALQGTDPMQVRVLDRNAFTPTSQVGGPTHVAWGRRFNLGVAGDVYLWPTPPASGVRLDYAYFREPPAMLASTDPPWFSQWGDYQDLIALHTAHQLGGQVGSAAAKDGVWYQRLEARKDEFRAALASGLDNPPMRLWRGTRSRRRTGSY